MSLTKIHVLYFNGLIIGKMNEKKENIFFIFVIFLTKFLVLILNIYIKHITRKLHEC